jgi:hypothetical protein
MIPRAKAKRKLEEQTADEEAIAKFDAEVASNVVRAPASKKPRNEVAIIEVVNIMADEIQAIYTEMGANIDDANARDKALVLWRHMHLNGHVRARDVKSSLELCEEHSDS